MKRTDVTYGQLDKVLRSLGFACHPEKLDVPALVYEDRDSGGRIILPPFPESERVLEYHLIMVRTTLDSFGIADPAVFAAKLKKAS
jgi:hypothetical protein